MHQGHRLKREWAVVALMAVCAGCGLRGGEGLTVTTRQQVHPVLIRNDRNPIVQVVVDAKETVRERLQSFEFALTGTDDVNDLESLELVHTGSSQTLGDGTMFGEHAAPAQKVTFHGDQALQAGPNIFWLSCRLKPGADLSHKVGAVLTAVRTGGGPLKVSGEPAGPPHRIGIALRKHNDDGVHTYRIPSMTRGPKGTLYAVYDMRRRMSRDLQEDIDIGLSRSLDGGRTWEPVKVIMDMGTYGNLPQEQNGVSDPGIIVDQKTGEIFVWAVWMWGKPGKHQWSGDGSEPGYEIGKSAQFMMVRSKDNGVTWTKPENLTRKLKKAEWWLLTTSPQAGINLKTGTLVQPAQGRDEKGETFATLLVSSDHGATWTLASPVFTGGNECQAAELSDGSVMLNIRNDHEPYRAVFVTSDLGRTWREHETSRKTLIEPNCNASLVSVDYRPGGEDRQVLLFANPFSQKARDHQTIQVSFDDGRTWPLKYHLLLDEGKGRGYPSMTRVDDRDIGIVYEGSQADLVFEKIGLNELLHL